MKHKKDKIIGFRVEREFKIFLQKRAEDERLTLSCFIELVLIDVLEFEESKFEFLEFDNQRGLFDSN